MFTANITYTDSQSISPDEFIDILNRSGLGERRPVNDINRIEHMLSHANLIITAWDENKLIGVSRSLTDFSYCCYLSDLAVDKDYQNQGIGKHLIDETRKRLGKDTLLLLLAAPAAAEYYPRIGFQKEEAAWSIRPAQRR